MGLKQQLQLNEIRFQGNMIILITRICKNICFHLYDQSVDSSQLFSYHNQNRRLDYKSRFTSSQAISIELVDYGGVYIGDSPREEQKDRKESVKVTTSNFSFGEESRADDSNITLPNQVPETNSNSSNATRATAPKLNNKAENYRKDSNIEALYKESKEHESIKRAIISYVIYFFATLIGLSFIDFLASKVDDSPIAVYTIIIFSSFYKLQRTFATLIMSIYCFERLHHLYKQTIENFHCYIVNLFV